MGFLIFLILLALGIFFGRMNERNHFAGLKKAEAELAHIKVFNLKHVPGGLEPGGTMVRGNVVIALDYFKKIMAGLRQIFGGRLNSYQSLMERARREAIVRMQRDAETIGATAIYNARLEFSTIGTGQGVGGVELLAYGTAVRAEV